MPLRSWWLALVPAILAACASSEAPRAHEPGESAAEKPSASSDDDPQEKAAKRSKLDREVAIENEKLIKARVELTHQEKANAESLRKAEAELAIVRDALRTFDEKESKTRLEKARLEVQEAKDSLDEAREELDQLEMMYKEQDLADKTREIVLKRGKRRLERAQARLALEQRDLETLEKDSLPQERAKLALAVEDKSHALDHARREAEEGLMEKKIAVMSGEAELARLREEIAALDRSAKK